MPDTLNPSFLRHICIVRTDAIGDVVLTLPMAGFLKNKIPGITLTFLCSSYTRDIVRCCSFVDHIIDIQQLEEFRKHSLPDAVIFVSPNARAARFFKQEGVLFRIGTSHRWFHWLYCNRLVNFSRKNSTDHEARLNFNLLRLLGYNLPEPAEILNYYGFHLPSGYIIRHDIYKVIQKPYIILHPKSRGSAREWGEENYIHLAETLHTQGYRVVVCGTEQEQKQLSVLPKLSFVTNLMGKLNLNEYIALIAEAHGLAAASTGPLHVAAMAGIRTAGLYPSIRPMHAGRWGPLGKQARAFYHEKEEGCFECINNSDCHCIRKIPIQSVALFLTK